MTTPSYNNLFVAPFYQNAGALYTPTINGGAWFESLPLTNLQDRRLKRVARSVDALNQNTRLRFDLKTDRQVRAVVLPSAYRGPDAPISSSGKIRVLGVPSSMLFDYEAGDDVVALGGTFSRTPTTDVRAATYIDRNGILKYAGENLAQRSQEFDNATWAKSGSMAAAANSVNGPTGTLTADTLTAGSANQTAIQDLGSLASAPFVFSIWLKRKTGSGNVQMTLDGGTGWTTKTLTTKWQRFFITQTLANPDIGLRIVTNGDAVYAWGGQAEHGTTPTSYVPTTSAINAAIRDGHFIGGYRHALLEAGRTNLLTRSEAFENAAWTKNTCTATADQATAPDGATTADLLKNSDGGGVAFHYVAESPSLTQNATYTATFFVKYVAGSGYVWIVGNTSTDVFAFFNISTGVVGTATGFDRTSITALGNSWYRISATFTNTAVTGVQDVGLGLSQDGSNVSWNSTGKANQEKVYVFGGQLELGAGPTSYIPTTSASVARSADALSFPFTPVPQAMTIYTKHVERGTTNIVTGGIVSLGTDTQFAALYASGGFYNFKQQATAGSQTKTAVAAPVFGDTVELRGVLSATGAIALGQSINAGAEVVTSTSGATALDATFNPQAIYLGGDGVALLNNGVAAIQSVRIAAGSKTLAEMQAMVYDSGFQNQYPTNATAETIDGMNVPHSLIIPDTQTPFRYCSVQVDDESNAAGYIDVGMVIIGGAWQPSVNMRTGAAIGHSTDSVISRTDGGAKIATQRPVYRTPSFTLPQLPETEGMVTASDLIRLLGTTGQTYWFWNPTDTSADYLHRRSMLCTIRELPRIAMPNATYNEVPFELEEDL